MKAVLVSNFVKNYDELKVVEVEDAQARGSKILVEVKAAGLNFVDLLYSRGKHQNNRSLVVPPFILGLEFAGVVSSIGGNSKFSVGDRIFGSTQGSFAEKVAVHDTDIFQVPDGWTFSAAAGLSATAPVSYGALIIRGCLKKGETVLIHAAAGGLGLMAVQIAKAAGANVIATASTSEKLGVAKRFGADYCVNYTSEEWWKEILDLTNGKGVDVVYDSVGLVDKSLKCIKHMGRMLIIGFAGREGDIEQIAMNRVLLKQVQIIGYRYGETTRRHPEETQEVWKGLMSMLDAGMIQPTVFDKKYEGLSSIPSAMNDLAARKIWGKAVILLGHGGQSHL